MNWEVVIPSNSATRLRRSVASILAKHPFTQPERIIVVDDGARIEWKKDDPAVLWVEGVKPFVYARNVNRGIQATTADNVIVMGDDVTVQTMNAFDIMAASMALRPTAGAMSAAIQGPVGNSHQHPHTKGVVRESPVELCFVCVMLPRAVLEGTGPLDEQFVYYGCEDVDYCFRLKDAGYRWLIHDGAVVVHNDSGMPSAFRAKEDILEQGQKAIELLKKKWPNRYK